MRDSRLRVTGERPRCAGSATEPSPKAHGVTEMSGSPRFRACCTTPDSALHASTVLWHGQLVQRVFGPPGTVTEGHGIRPKTHGGVEFPTSSSTDRPRCGLSRPDPRRNPHSLPSREKKNGRNTHGNP